jgi:hypothetical protein
MQYIDYSVINEFPSNCLYGFIDEEGKSFYLFHSSNALLELAKQLTDLRDNIHKCLELQGLFNSNKLKLIVYKAYSPETSQYTVRAEYTIVVTNLETQGWKNMRGEYKAGEFKLKAYVYTLPKTKEPLFYVIAESKRKEKIVLGVFDTINDGKDWITAHFPSKDMIVPVFADNDRTKAYHASNGVKLIE